MEQDTRSHDSETIAVGEATVKVTEETDGEATQSTRKVGASAKTVIACDEVVDTITSRTDEDHEVELLLSEGGLVAESKEEHEHGRKKNAVDVTVHEVKVSACCKGVCQSQKKAELTEQAAATRQLKEKNHWSAR